MKNIIEVSNYLLAIETKIFGCKVLYAGFETSQLRNWISTIGVESGGGPQEYDNALYEGQSTGLNCCISQRMTKLWSISLRYSAFNIRTSRIPPSLVRAWCMNLVNWKPSVFHMDSVRVVNDPLDNCRFGRLENLFHAPATMLPVLFALLASPSLTFLLTCWDFAIVCSASFFAAARTWDVPCWTLSTTSFASLRTFWATFPRFKLPGSFISVKDL